MDWKINPKKQKTDWYWMVFGLVIKIFGLGTIVLTEVSLYKQIKENNLA